MTADELTFSARDARDAGDRADAMGNGDAACRYLDEMADCLSEINRRERIARSSVYTAQGINEEQARAVRSAIAAAAVIGEEFGAWLEDHTKQAGCFLLCGTSGAVAKLLRATS